MIANVTLRLHVFIQFGLSMKLAHFFVGRSRWELEKY